MTGGKRSNRRLLCRHLGVSLAGRRKIIGRSPPPNKTRGTHTMFSIREHPHATGACDATSLDIDRTRAVRGTGMGNLHEPG